MIVITPAPQTSTQQQQQPPPAYDPEMAELFERRQSLKYRKTMWCLRSKSLGSPSSSSSNTVPFSNSPFAAPSSSSLQNRVEDAYSTLRSEDHSVELGLEATKEHLRAANSGQDAGVRPSHRIASLVDPVNGYLDDFSTIHRLSFEEDNIPEVTGPSRPPKVPLQQSASTQEPVPIPLPISDSGSRKAQNQELDYIERPVLQQTAGISGRRSLPRDLKRGRSQQRAQRSTGLHQYASRRMFASELSACYLTKGSSLVGSFRDVPEPRLIDDVICETMFWRARSSQRPKPLLERLLQRLFFTDVGLATLL